MECVLKMGIKGSGGICDIRPHKCVIECQKEYIHWINGVNENGYCIKHVNILPPLLCVKLKI